MICDIPDGYQVLLHLMENRIVGGGDVMAEEPETRQVRVPALVAPMGILSRPMIKHPAWFQVITDNDEDLVWDLGALRARTIPRIHDAPDHRVTNPSVTQARMAHRAFLRLRPGEFVRLSFWVWYYVVLRIR